MKLAYNFLILLDRFLRLIGLERLHSIDWKWWYEYAIDQLDKETYRFRCEERRLIDKLVKAEKEIAELNHKLQVRRKMTPPFNEAEHFQNKKMERVQKYWEKVKGSEKRFDLVHRNLKNGGVNILIVDLEEPPRHEPIEIRP